jgi:hypothetical protein
MLYSDLPGTYYGVFTIIHLYFKRLMIKQMTCIKKKKEKKKKKGRHVVSLGSKHIRLGTHTSHAPR